MCVRCVCIVQYRYVPGVLDSNVLVHDELAPLTLTPFLPLIARCFSQSSVTHIRTALTGEANDKSKNMSEKAFAHKCLHLMSKASPMSLAVIT